MPNVGGAIDDAVAGLDVGAEEQVDELVAARAGDDVGQRSMPWRAASASRSRRCSGSG